MTGRPRPVPLPARVLEWVRAHRHHRPPQQWNPPPAERGLFVDGRRVEDGPSRAPDATETAAETARDTGDEAGPSPARPARRMRPIDASALLHAELEWEEHVAPTRAGLIEGGMDPDEARRRTRPR